VLGLQPKASANDVKLAYYHLAIASSQSNSSAPDAQERFNEVGRAYSAISGEPFSLGDSSAVPHASASGESPLQQAPFVRAYPDLRSYLGYIKGRMYCFVNDIMSVPNRTAKLCFVLSMSRDRDPPHLYTHSINRNVYKIRQQKRCMTVLYSINKLTIQMVSLFIFR